MENADNGREATNDGGLQKDIEALERVLFRLASVTDDRMLVVLQSLLPQLLRLFPRTLATQLEVQLKDKILEVLSHVKTRLQAMKDPHMPLEALGTLLSESDEMSVFTTSFALLFIELGFAAATLEERARVVATTLKSLAKWTTPQQEAFFRLLLQVLPASANAIYKPASIEKETTDSSSDVDMTKTEDEEDLNVDILLDFLLDFILYDHQSTTSASTAPAATANQVTEVYGLMSPRLERLQRVVKPGEYSKETLYECQLNALKLVKALAIPSKKKYVHYLAGSASFHHAIKSYCEEQLSRVLKYEESELEDTVVVRRIISLILGSQMAQSTGTFEGQDLLLLGNRKRIADPSILQALTLLTASKAATNVQPMMLQLLCQLMFGVESSRPSNVANKIKLAGVGLCQWTLHNCELSYLEKLLGPVLFPTLLRVLMEQNNDSDRANLSFVREFHHGIYESIGLIGIRFPVIVAASEQTFQVILVRCLAEEEQRSGVGANAIKCFEHLAMAYGKAASQDVQASIRNELVGLLNGSKLFDESKNYGRVRAAIASWCGELLRSAANDDIAMRIALLKLSADKDEEVRRLTEKSLYCEPLPSIKTLATSMRSIFPQMDLKKSMRDVKITESCINFCLRITRESFKNGEMETGDEKQIVVEYLVRTFLEHQDGDYPSSVYETAASALVNVSTVVGPTLPAILSTYVQELLSAASKSLDQTYLLNIGALVACTIDAKDFPMERIFDEIIQVIVPMFDISSIPINQLCGIQYVLGAVLGSLVGHGKQLLRTHYEALVAAFTKTTELLANKVQLGSNFNAYPRGEEDQNAPIVLLRSIMDGVGLAGSLKLFLRDDTYGNVWSQLKVTTLSQLQKVIEWNLSAVSTDGHLKLKLANLKRVAIQTLGQCTYGLPNDTLNEELILSLESVLEALLKLGKEIDPELQFVVGEVVVALGTHDVTGNILDSTEQTFDRNRAAVIFSKVMASYAGSTQPVIRRSAVIWLLCISAAGLTSTKVEEQSTSWSIVLHSSAYSHLLLEAHEFFVSMLNDSNDVAKECAVKGLAYLRLNAPTKEVGDQFSDSLFRRLRCFRAFTTSSDSAADAEESNGNVNPSPIAETPGRSSVNTGTTVENAAYREVSNVAAEIGDPELMYALLYLSTADPIWQAFADESARPYGVARAGDMSLFTFAETDRKFRDDIIEKAGQLWISEEYVESNKLVPWLYLLKFHSNTKVANVMTNLWTFAKGKFIISSAQEKRLLKQHWDLLFQFLLSKLENSRNFKYREAACLALIDLLNGAEAENIRADFLRLWKLSLRAVDDIMEAVGLAGIKLFRYVGESSLRVATTDETCRIILLQFLISDGIVSKNTVCRALSIDLLLRLVKALEATAMQDILASLLLKLLEYLSSLEMPELQYAQFHVEKKDQLERLRVSLSQAGPVGQLLELATTRLNELAGTEVCVNIVEELARGVANLLKFGVGLNTRVGTANFVATLAVELPYELRKCNGAEYLLTKALIPFIGAKVADENDQYGDGESRYGNVSGALSDGLVIQSYCRAAAYLCPLVDATMVKAYVRDGIFAFNRALSSNGDKNSARSNADEVTKPTTSSHVYTSRFLLISAIATKELVMKTPPISDLGTVVTNDRRNDWYCTYVFPAAFIGQFASTELLKSTWLAVLEELPPTILYSEQSIDAVLRSIALLIGHTAWDTRKQAASALHALFSSSSAYRSRISAVQMEHIWNDLLAAVPGRLWKGKGAILEALVTIASPEQTEANGEKILQLSELLEEECHRAWKNRDMEYLESAIDSLGKLSALLTASTQQKLRLSSFQTLRATFTGWLARDPAIVKEETDALTLSPLMIKRVFEALALIWPSQLMDSSSNSVETSADTLTWILESIKVPEFNVWSIRKALFQTLAAVVASVPPRALTSSRMVERIIERCCGEYGVGDAKYSMIRVASAKVLLVLMKRQDDRDLVLQLLVHRERVHAAVEKLKSHEEPTEQHIAYEMMTQLVQLQ